MHDYWTLTISKVAVRNARATSLIYHHSKNDTSKYKNPLNKLWNEVGRDEVLKVHEQDDRAGMTTTSRHPHIYHEVCDYLKDVARDVYL